MYCRLAANIGCHPIRVYTQFVYMPLLPGNNAITPNPNAQLPAARSVDAVALVGFHTLTIRYFLTLGV
jgi:hypothetical protein